MKRTLILMLLFSVSVGCSKKESTDTTTTDTPTATEEPKAEPAKTPEEPAAAKTPEEPAKAEAKHLEESAAKPFFEAEYAGYKMDGDMKIKPKDDKWHEIKATYKGDGGEIKLTINDWPPAGNPEWKTKLEPANKKTAGYMSMMEQKDDKHTLMVLVGERFRVDFKTRDAKPEELERMAEAFDFDGLKKLASK